MTASNAAPLCHYGPHIRSKANRRHGIARFVAYETHTASAITDLTAIIEAYGPEKVIELVKAIDQAKSAQYGKSRARRSSNKIIAKLADREKRLADQCTSDLQRSLSRATARRAA